MQDGGFAFGQTLGHGLVDLGCERAGEHGIAALALRRAGHLGRIGAWAEAAAERGIVSVWFVNVARSALVAPFGAAGRRLSTAPFAVGVPVRGEAGGEGRHFILDFATSRVAEGKVLMAHAGGKPVPHGALIDGDGHPTDDPHALYGDVPPGAVPDPRAGGGALTAFGDHKGSGLALACELLAGALTGSGATGPGDGAYNGALAFFVVPDRVNRGWSPAVADYLEWVRGTPPVAGAGRVLVPGDRERALRVERTRDGVPLPGATWQAIRRTALGLGLDPDSYASPR